MNCSLVGVSKNNVPKTSWVEQHSLEFTCPRKNPKIFKIESLPAKIY